MAKFLFVYRGSGEAEAKMTPDEMQQMMQKWGQWIGEAMAKGWMVEARRRPHHGRPRRQREESRDRRPVCRSPRRSSAATRSSRLTRSTPPPS